MLLINEWSSIYTLYFIIYIENIDTLELVDLDVEPTVGFVIVTYVDLDLYFLERYEDPIGFIVYAPKYNGCSSVTIIRA